MEYSILDPLALFYLSDIAKQEGYDSKITLSKGPKYEEFKKAIKEFNPDFFGVMVYTGNHMDIWKLFEELGRNNEN